MRNKSILTLSLLCTSFWLLIFAGQAQADVIGMDVSRWQGTIDWDTAQTHVDFAIIKAGGSDVGMYADREFVRNRDEARRLGIPRGYYYFAGGGDPVSEAEHFASITGELLPGEVVALDMEIDTPHPVAYSYTFLKRTEELLGVKPLLYTNMNRVWGNDWRPVAEEGYPLWGAIFDHDYETFPRGGAWPEPSIKQFTSKGSIPGVNSQYVDLNVVRGDISAFQGLGKAEVKVEPETPRQPAAPAPQTPETPPDLPRVPKPGYMGGLGDGRRNSLDSGQVPPFPSLPDEPEAAAKAGEQEQSIATESHKGSASDANSAIADEYGQPAGSFDPDQEQEQNQDQDQQDFSGQSDGYDAQSGASQVPGEDGDQEKDQSGDRSGSSLRDPDKSVGSALDGLIRIFLPGLHRS